MDPDYPYFIYEPENGDEFSALLAHWFAKIVEFTRMPKYNGPSWNVLVADLWLDSGRIIGHVQQDDVAVGYDTGFRVCADFSRLGKLAAGNDADDSERHVASGWLREAVTLEPARSALAARTNEVPFYIAITAYGQGEITEAERISFGS